MIEKLNKKRVDKQSLSEKIYFILGQVYGGRSPWNQAQILSEIERPESEWYLAVDEGSGIIGFMAVQVILGECEITNLAILPKFQKKGLASALLGRIIGFPGTVFLEVRASNMVAQSLYKKFGFVKFHVRKDYYSHPKEDAYLLRKEI